MQRRQFVVPAAAAALLPASSGDPQTFVYSNSGGCEVKADVLGAPAAGRKPVTVWIHGGARILGSRRLPPNSRVPRPLLDAGFAVVSIDYRLAPETKLAGIIEDVQHAFRRIRANAGKLRLEPDRVAVCGASAGGYNTLMAAFSVRPRPRALVSYWGYGDIAGFWYSRPVWYGHKNSSCGPLPDGRGSVQKSAHTEPRPSGSGRSGYSCTPASVNGVPPV